MFKLAKIENGRVNVGEPEYIAVTASVAVKAGDALVLTGGVLALATGTIKPTHVAGASIGAAETKRVIPALRIEANQIYRAPISPAPTSSTVPGAKVTVNDTADGVTATTEGGVATIVSLGEATASGDHILVRFV